MSIKYLGAGSQIFLPLEHIDDSVKEYIDVPVWIDRTKELRIIELWILVDMGGWLLYQKWGEYYGLRQSKTMTFVFAVPKMSLITTKIAVLSVTIYILSLLENFMIMKN